ncbi:hypothetical protein D3C78_1829100 [compost metagenome]
MVPITACSWMSGRDRLVSVRRKAPLSAQLLASGPVLWRMYSARPLPIFTVPVGEMPSSEVSWLL